jgi:ribosome-associated protein
MIPVADDIAIEDREVHERFVRAAGARGQNARREATAVELRFDIGASLLPLEVKDRLRLLAGRTITSEDVLIVTSRANRSLEDNRKAARARLLALLQRAATPPAERLPTHAGRFAREERLSEKRRHASVKALRRVPRATSRA